MNRYLPRHLIDHVLLVEMMMWGGKKMRARQPPYWEVHEYPSVWGTNVWDEPIVIRGRRVLVLG